MAEQKVSENVADTKGAQFEVCWCTDDQHSKRSRSATPIKALPGDPGRGGADKPHLIGVRTFEVVWRVEA